MEPHGIRRIQFNCYKVKEADWVGGDNGVGNPSAKAMAELGKQPQPISLQKGTESSRPRNVRLEAELFLPRTLRSEDRLQAVRRSPKSHRIVGAIAEANEGFDVAAFMSGMSPEQRCILGFPSVGSEYWTAETIAATAARYPEMDMAPYEEAASVSAAANQSAKL